MLPIVILGAGGMGREALAWIIDAYPARDIVGFLDERAVPGTTVADFSVLGTDSWLDGNGADVVVAIGASRARQAAVVRLRHRGISPLTVVHPTAYVGPGVTIGQGSIICPNVTLTRDVSVGHAAIVNYGAQVGHDCSVEDWAFIAPGVNLAGNVTVETGANVGIGASAVQGVTIGKWSTIGAGAVVIDDIPAGSTAVGVPCRPTGAKKARGRSV